MKPSFFFSAQALHDLMSKIVVDDIERTEDYIAFIEQLKSFHSTKG
jgi:hypothetical protein